MGNRAARFSGIVSRCTRRVNRRREDVSSRAPSIGGRFPVTYGRAVSLPEPEDRRNSADLVHLHYFCKGLPPVRSHRLRNAAVALGNRGSSDAVSALAIALDDEEPLVRGHARGRWGAPARRRRGRRCGGAPGVGHRVEFDERGIVASLQDL